ncbi:MAG: hypothetical protein GY765_30510 [bacterium]|nr:hypothetical protein [bacterium]
MQVTEYPVIWFQASACSGCTVSVLNTVNPDVRRLLIEPILPGKHLSLMFHLTLMAGTGEMAIDFAESSADLTKGKYILVIEGAVPYKDDDPVPIYKTLEKFARDADIIIALGTCATSGGIPAAAPNPTNCHSVNHFLSAVEGEGINTPFINLTGCPCHPQWFTRTIVDILQGQSIDLDEFSRPYAVYKETVHTNCPRHDDYMKDIFAQYPGDKGCFKEIGCMGRVTHTDCPIIKWNGGVSWCIEAGTHCIGCANPYFPEIEITEI